MITNLEVLNEITRYYLESYDFNGLSIAALCENLSVEWKDLHGIVSLLVEQELVGAIFSDVEINTHIIRTGFEPKESQIEKLPNGDFHHTCLYPLPAQLKRVVKQDEYINNPYMLEMALGAPQLSYRSFDLSILEYYRNDPRYIYDNAEVSGFICADAKYYELEIIAERDDISLDFGFSYDSDFSRAVAVFLRYLARLSPEHRQIWKAKELEGDYKLHPDYYRQTITGDGPERVSIFYAFVMEINLINKMSEAMGRPTLFRSNYGNLREDKPRKFGFLVRSTLEEFNDFILLLDQMLSDDIDKRFFMNEVPYEIEIPRKDGKIIVQNKGTLTILDDWIRYYYRLEDWAPWENALTAFRAVRKARQKPAHLVNENVFNQKYLKKQREIIIQAYDGIRTLRMILQNDPSVIDANIQIPDWLNERRIWTY